MMLYFTLWKKGIEKKGPLSILSTFNIMSFSKGGIACLARCGVESKKNMPVQFHAHNCTKLDMQHFPYKSLRSEILAAQCLKELVKEVGCLYKCIQFI